MKKRTLSIVMLTVMAVSVLCGCSSKAKGPKLTLIGHSSTKIVTKEGTVIYIDPFYDGDYSEPADIVLITHNHNDHNRIDLITKKDSTVVITEKDALKKEEYQSFDECGVKIEAVPAYNQNHRVGCVGYLLTFDNITVYHAGDTSLIDSMSSLADKHITYAMLPIDGQYNMGPEEAMEVAKLIQAQYVIPMHTCGDLKSFDQENVDAFNPDGKTVVKYGDTITLISPENE